MEENVTLVEEGETKDKGILMMANEDITLDSDMVWSLDTGASNDMCGTNILLLIYKR